MNTLCVLLVAISIIEAVPQSQRRSSSDRSRYVLPPPSSNYELPRNARQQSNFDSFGSDFGSEFESDFGSQFNSGGGDNFPSDPFYANEKPSRPQRYNYEQEEEFFGYKKPEQNRPQDYNQRPLNRYAQEEPAQDYNKRPLNRYAQEEPEYLAPKRQNEQRTPYDEFGNRQLQRNFNRQPNFDRYEQERFQEQQPPRRLRVPPSKQRNTYVDHDLQSVVEDVEVEKVPRRRQATVSSVKPQKLNPKLALYKPASGPAYQTATNIDELNSQMAEAQPRFDPIPYDVGVANGLDVPAEQRSIQEAVIHGANSYKPDGVYQKEDRLEFQIHGHQGPHSYRYGYDTGNGYNRQFRYEERNKDGYVKGRYGFFDRYGKLQIVNYSADPYKGFHAEGAHVPQYPH